MTLLAEQREEIGSGGAGPEGGVAEGADGALVEDGVGGATGGHGTAVALDVLEAGAEADLVEEVLGAVWC